MSATPRYELLVAGCGAIGSRVAAACTELGAAMTFADNQCVLPENLGVSAFDPSDLLQGKAHVLAARRRAGHEIGRALQGDVRYTVRPGLVRRLDAVVLCLDNATALHDAAAAVWGGSTPLPVLMLTCGSDADTYQVRLFVPPGPCVVCLFGEAERHADHGTTGVSCVDTSAPRAAAAAAAAAAHAGAAILARWYAGDRTLANCRVQRDAKQSAEYVIRMPGTVSPRCPVPHGSQGERHEPIAGLGGAISAVTVGMLAERAIAYAGDDAEVGLGRRAVPLGGLYCPRCRAVAPAPPLLMPAAVAAWCACDCGAIPRPLGVRSTISARELRCPEVVSLSLAAWGAGHGDEFVTAGSRGRIRLRCTFEWSHLDAP